MVGRSRKKNNRRIDAAIAALGKGGLGPGFPQDVVRKTINTLLKVYGGDDGWAFIEENSYLLVIETILENQEKSDKGGDDAEAIEAAGEPSPSPHLLLPAEDEPSILPLVPADSHPGVAVGEGSSLLPVLAGPDCTRETAVPGKQRRQPAFGWISESESEEEDPVKKESESSTRNRRIEWDVIPRGIHG